MSALLVSCKGDSQFSNVEAPVVAMQTYSNPNNRYSIQYPEDWGYDEGRVTFTTQRVNESGGMLSMVVVTAGTPSDLGFDTDIEDCVDNIVSEINKGFGKAKAVIFKGNDAFECIFRNEEGPYPYGIRFVVFTDEYVWDILGVFANIDDKKIGEYIISSLEIK